MVKKPKFVETVNGKVHTLYCKLCTRKIAGVVSRPSGSGPYIKVMAERFKRFSVYSEVKFRCNDGSHHVTNGCRGCLSRLNDLEVMTEMLLADADEQGREEKRTVVKLVAFDASGTGLV